MNYSEYFGKNPNAGWGASGTKETNKEDWSNYFQPGTPQVPIKKMYSDSPVVIDNKNGQVKTYMDVDPVVVQRPTHEQMIMEQQQMAASRRLAEEQKAYYDKVWNDKVKQMEDEFAGEDKPKTVKKLSFVDNPKAVEEQTQHPVNIDVPQNAAPGYENNKPMTEEEMQAAIEKLNEESKKLDELEKQKQAEEELQKAEEHGDPIEDEVTEEPIPDAIDEPADVFENEVKEEIEDTIEPILPQDAEVEDIVEEEDDVVETEDEVKGDIEAEPESEKLDDTLGDITDEDIPSDLPEELAGLNIDEEYEAERNARIAAKEAEAEETKKKSNRGRKKATNSSETSKRKKPVVKTESKKK